MKYASVFLGLSAILVSTAAAYPGPYYQARAYNVATDDSYYNHYPENAHLQRRGGLPSQQRPAGRQPSRQPPRQQPPRNRPARKQHNPVQPVSHPRPLGSAGGYGTSNHLADLCGSSMCLQDDEGHKRCRSLECTGGCGPDLRCSLPQ